MPSTAELSLACGARLPSMAACSSARKRPSATASRSVAAVSEVPRPLTRDSAWFSSRSPETMLARIRNSSIARFFSATLASITRTSSRAWASSVCVELAPVSVCCSR
ncbi:MAG: hypothetical protein IPF55_21090 [Rhodoferax sp.]|nr:hypothetical protein [Rhodoferax sp.]